MKFYNQIPFFRLITPFVVGIVFAAFMPCQIKFWWVILAFSSALTVGIGLFKLLYKNYSWRWIYGLILTTTLIINGYFLTIGNIQIFSSSHIGSQEIEKTWFQVRVTDPVEEKAKSYKVAIEVESFRDDIGWQKTHGKVITYIQKSDAVANIKYGDVLLLNTQLNEISPPNNPGEFNYKRYLRFHNIYHQSYIHESDWINTGKNEGNFLFKWSNSLRTHLLRVFKQYGIMGNEYGVASALVLGYKGALEDELMRAYSSTGATHVLAVSGLHVGIIFVILDSLLMFLDRMKYGHIVKAILLVGFLWFYAILTGLSPSVLRAATMFSFIVVARATKRNTNIYNTLAVSALFLLLFNPLLIMEVGFQLSYLAVIGIVYLQPKIYSWLEPKNWLLDKIWGLTAVSIAAQIATFPLGLLYFHQFPNYFFISNLVVIPLATFIVYTGILLFFVSWIPLLATWVSKALFWLIWVMNYCVKLIESIPYSLTEGLTINITETWMIYLIIITSLIYFAYKEAKYLHVAMSCMLLLVSYQLYQGSSQIHQSKFVVYHVPQTTAFEFIDGQTSFLIADSSLINDGEKMLFYVKHHWWEIGASYNQLIDRSDSLSRYQKKYGNDFYVHNNKSVAIINNQKIKHSSLLDVDYLIISKLKYLDLGKLVRNYTFNTLIFDSSNPKWITKKWKIEAQEMGLNVHSVPNDGAFVADI
ncbi:MAG: ComEC/Rec2 family competence protein [Flavobacteriales bacterium]|nr:ComEC/Rec2 family competence protein [Flavobacteriales bacterium]